MSKKKPPKQSADKSLPSVDEAREADYYARKVGLTKKETLKIIRDAKSTSPRER